MSTYLVFVLPKGLVWVALARILCAQRAAVAAEAGTDPDDVRVPPKPPAVLALMADVGVPDGVITSLALCPTPWLRLHAGGGTNTASPGFRGGFALVPFGAGPALGFEVGTFRAGKANEVVKSLIASDDRWKSLVERVGYDYVNAQLGFEIGRHRFSFFLHAGLSYVRATLYDMGPALQERVTGMPIFGESTTVTLHKDPVVRALTLSAKLGLILYLW